MRQLSFPPTAARRVSTFRSQLCQTKLNSSLGHRARKKVALALKISVRTCETHRAGLIRKRQLNSLADIVRYAIRHGLVDP